jgi:hypothetical protein
VPSVAAKVAFTDNQTRARVMSVPSYDLLVKQGNNASWEFRMKSYNEDGDLVPFDLTGSTLTFVAEKDDGTKLTKTLTPSSASGGIVPLSITVSESRDFTIGRENRWEIERRISGAEATILQGYVICREGINSDA